MGLSNGGRPTLETTARRALVVVGMHRSGTSAMTRMLSLLGAALPKRLMDSHPDNPVGFWEPQSIADLNDEILRSLDSDWDDVFAFRPKPYLSNFDGIFVDRAVDLLESEFNGSEVIVFKDPRVSVLTAFWDRALNSAGYSANYIIMVRNPLEVAESLRLRNSFPREKSLLLWSSYMLAVERDTRSLSRTFVSYGDLMRDWRSVRSRLETATGAPFPRDTAAAANEIDRFLDPKLRHHVVTDDDLAGREDVPQHVKTLYQVFSRACGPLGSSQETIDCAVIDTVRSELSEIESIVGPLVADLRAQTRLLESEVVEAQEARDAADGRAQGLAEELATERTEAADSLARIGRERDALDARLRAESEQRQSQLVETAKLRGDLSLRESELRQRQEEIEQTRANLARANSTVETLRAELSAAEERIEAERKLSEDRAELQHRLEAAGLQLEQALSNQRLIEARLEELTAALDQSQAEKRSLDHALDKMASELDQSRTQMRTFEKRLSDRAQEVEELTQLLSEAQASDRRSRERLEWLAETNSVLTGASGPRKRRILSLIPTVLQRRRSRRLLKRHGLFDSEAYLAANPDVAAEGADPLQHYLLHGLNENRRWDSAGLKFGKPDLRDEPEIKPAGFGGEVAQRRSSSEGADQDLQQLEHSQTPTTPVTTPRKNGAKSPGSASESGRRDAVAARLQSMQKRRRAQLAAQHDEVQRQLSSARTSLSRRVIAASPQALRSAIRGVTRRHRLAGTAIFDRQWIQDNTGNASPSFSQFMRDPKFRQVDPHPLFAASRYLESNPDVAESGIAPLQHYLEDGWREGRDPHPYFANDWYLEQNPDVLEAGVNPLEHYLRLGWREGRFPNPVFDPAAYLDWNPDVKEAGIEPLTHYVMYGHAEERQVPFHGFERDWRSILSNSSQAALMDVLLASAEPDTSDAYIEAAEGTGAWPPEPLNHYWPTQRLRELIVQGYGEKTLALHWFLCSVMDAFSENPEAFADSEVCDLILERIRVKSEERANKSDGPPAATIIIPVYNNFLDTVLCLASVFEIDAYSSFDVIVADDQSTDATQTLLATIGGLVHYLRQPKNLGFLGNCNSAATQAQGGVVVLLNNDTLVLPGWLDALLSPFERSELVGLVGSKLISWDGTLQEAGGIFWQDGSAWNFGRGQDARAPEYNYLKEVDYCSGASIAVPTALWRRLGGFDTAYAPAYCEDSDIAFRIRAAGYRTLYNPQSEVIHHEGRSHGRDVGSGIKAYQVRNQERLFDRWGDLLRTEHFPNAQNVLRARDRSQQKTHVLVIDHYVPQWDQDAGSRTIFQYLEILLELGMQVTFWPDNLYQDPIYTPVLQSMGIEVIYGPKFRGGFEEFIKNRSDLYEAIFISRPHIASEYLPALKANTSARILYYGHDLHFRRMEASRALGEELSDERISEMRQLELGVCQGCDVILYPDPAEVNIVAEEIGGDRIFVANPVFVYDDAQIDAGRRRVEVIPSVQGENLFFVGGFNHTPNREGITWFVTEVMPLIWEQVPGARLDIAGSNPPADVKVLTSGRVAVLGRISDEALHDLYARAALAVAPLRYGAGVKGKVIEAMAYGVPVATTSVGAQGIDVGQRGLFIGDNPEQLANAIIEALNDRAEAQRRAECALDFIRHHYGRTAMMDLFRRLIVDHLNA